MEDQIIILGARENNLKNIGLRIPKGEMVVFTGVSGSGKSSLVFDTIAVEAMRQLNETFPLYIRNRMPHYEPPKVEKIDGLTTAIVIDQRHSAGNIRSTVGTMTDLQPLLRLLFSRWGEPSAGASSAYSFNDPQGMCDQCSGLGKTIRFDFDKVLDTSKSLNQGAILFPGHQTGTYQWMLYANSGFFDPDKPLEQFSDQEWQDLLHGSGVNVPIQSQKGKKGIWESYHLSYEGLQDRIERLYLKRDLNSLSKNNKKIIQEFTRELECPECSGARLQQKALDSRIRGRNIWELGEMEVSDLIEFLEGLKIQEAKTLLRQLLEGLSGMAELGLEYLNLNRPSVSLSGGEAQRLKLVRHLGSSLVGLTYIFDEPSAGLHPKDVNRLNRILLRLRDRGNSILVVEHDRDVIRMADQVVDMGPLAGRKGGAVVFQGTLEALLEQDTLTARWMKREVPVKANPRPWRDKLLIENASLHNLKDITLEIPEKVLTVVTGVSGSGKTSLICGELLKQYPKVIHINQAPVGNTSRSNPATYLGIMDEIRRIFGRENGVDPGLFSFNSEGACEGCGGKGVRTTEMAFMDPVTVPCEVCGGTKYSPRILDYTWEGLTILDVLALTVVEAIDVFQEPKIQNKLKMLEQVGLGYITLGQPTATLSGGESQRLRLAAHLKAKNSIYAMDEPSTGLHGADTEVLMKLLNRLVDNGNTVIVAEHDPDIVRQADWIIELGPAGGKNGGWVLFEGLPSRFFEDK